MTVSSAESNSASSQDWNHLSPFARGRDQSSRAFPRTPSAVLPQQAAGKDQTSHLLHLETVSIGGTNTSN